MNCPACESKRLHGPIDWAQHPYAGHGFVPGQGWTHPDLMPLLTRVLIHEAESAEEKENSPDAR